jgi:hypothetical protein
MLIEKIIIISNGIQSGEGMKKELHPLGVKIKENYSVINEVLSIAVL